MYRIISGRWKAKKIVAPKNFDVRPTTDFAKEALFSILEHQYDLEFCRVLDLFSGIGSISLEFASRGVEDITCVDVEVKHLNFISLKAKELDMEKQLKFIKSDAYFWLEKNKNKKKYDIIFADAPFQNTEMKQYKELIKKIFNGNYLTENGVLVLEHSSRLSWVEDYPFVEFRKYGNIGFSFFYESSLMENASLI